MLLLFIITSNIVAIANIVLFIVSIAIMIHIAKVLLNDETSNTKAFTTLFIGTGVILLIQVLLLYMG